MSYYIGYQSLIKKQKADSKVFNGTLKTCSTCKNNLPRTRDFWCRQNDTADCLRGACIEDVALETGEKWARKNNKPFNTEGITASQLRIMKSTGCRLKNLWVLCNGILNMDHDHKTGKIRGYLCSRHNMNILWPIDNLMQCPQFERDRILGYIMGGVPKPSV